MIFGCAASVLVLNSGVLAKDMGTADSVNLVAGVAVFVEPEGVSALDILLHPFGRNGNTEKSSKEATDIMGGIVGADMAHKGWTCQSLLDGLTPFHNSIPNPILQEKRENLLGDLVGGMGGGRTRNDTDPYDDGTKTPLLLLSQQSVGEEDNRRVTACRSWVQSSVYETTLNTELRLVASCRVYSLGSHIWFKISP